jgi:hypothetical protein
MATAEVEIIYKSNVQGLEASVSKITDSNNAILKSTEDTTKKIADDFKKVGAAGAAAFGSTQVKNALDKLNDESIKLRANLRKLQEEQVELIGSGNKVSKAFKDNAAAQAALKAQINEVTAQQKELNQTFGQTEQKQLSLTGQLRQLKQQLSLLEQAGQENTQQFEELTLKAARLEDQIGDTRERVRVLASDTFKFDAAVGAVQGLTAGFEIAQGAAALFGEENKNLQEIINKTTALTAIANGVQQIAGLVTGQAATKLGLLSVAKNIYTFATTGATAATKAFRAAIVTTGVGALAVALGFLVEKLISTSDSSDETTESLKRLKAATDEAATSARKAATERAIAAIKLEQAEGKGNKAAQDAAIRKLELDGAIIDAEEEKNKKLIQVQEAFDEEIKKSKEASEERDKLFIQQKANAAKDEQLILIEQETADKIATIQNNARAAELDAEKAAAKEAEDKAKEARDKASEAAKKAAEDRLKIIEETIKVELLTENEAVQEKIRLAENLADQARLDAKQNIDNANLRAATIKRIDAELAKQRQEILVEEQKRILSNEIQRLETLQEAGQLELKQAEELAKKRAELAQQDATLITDPTARVNAEKAAEVKLQNDLKQIRFEAAQKEAELEIARLELQQRRGDFTIATQEAIANEQFELRAEQLKKEAAQTKEAQEKLTIDLELNEADRQRRLAEIKANGLIKELEIENTRIETLKVLGQDTLDDRIRFIENEAEAKRKAIQKELISEEEKAAKLELLNAQTQQAIRKEREQTDLEAIDNALKIGKELNEIFGTFIEIQKELSEQRIQQFTDAAEIEKENINNSLDEYEDKNRKLEASELRLQRKIAAEKLKQAKLDKAKAIFDVFLNTAQAVTAAYAASVATFGQPFASFAAAQGLLQASLIAAKPLPKFKRGGMIGGRSHEAGGTMIEAEKGEFVVNKNSVSKHRDVLEAMNRSSHDFKRYIEQRYVRPALLDIATGRKDKGVQVNATLNAKNMEREIKGLRKDLKGKNTTININGFDSRYSWRSN